MPIKHNCVQSDDPRFFHCMSNSGDCYFYKQDDVTMTGCVDWAMKFCLNKKAQDVAREEHDTRKNCS